MLTVFNPVLCSELDWAPVYWLCDLGNYPRLPEHESPLVQWTPSHLPASSLPGCQNVSIASQTGGSWLGVFEEQRGGQEGWSRVSEGWVEMKTGGAARSCKALRLVIKIRTWSFSEL